MKTSYPIELKSVSKSYGKAVVVNAVDIQVIEGECFVLIGHNGAGKTSIMKLMLGLTRPGAGEVRVLGENPATRAFAAQRRSLGYLPESASFYPNMTGLELLRYYARLKNIPQKVTRELLEQVGLTDAATRRLNTYSKGMRQRLGLAQALLGPPKLLFLDEPTTGLDPLLRNDFYQIIRDLRRDGTTIVISSHALNEIETLADRIAIIRNGKQTACGNLAELSQQVNLPVRTRLAVAAGNAQHIAEKLTGHVKVNSVNDHNIDLVCQEDEKVFLLQHIASLGDSVLDVTMTEPRLDEIYLHYMNGEQS